MNAVSYIRVSTGEQGNSGAGLEAQLATIRRESAHRGLTVTQAFQDIESGSGKRPLPGRDQAIEHCANHGTMLIVAKLDRLGRSALDVHRIDEQARKHGFAIVALDLGIDTSTPMGRAMMGMAAVFAQLEREMISQRTKDGLAAKKAQGVQLGRPATITPSVRLLARELHEDGWTTMQIAALFNDMGLPTPRGGQMWRDSSLRSALQ
jgi:DNA invertase Pin-like site-specific DNA recombinase